MNKEKYLRIIKKTEDLQNELMLIDNYDEEVYQALQKVIYEIEDLLDEE